MGASQSHEASIKQIVFNYKKLEVEVVHLDNGKTLTGRELKEKYPDLSQQIAPAVEENIRKPGSSLQNMLRLGRELSPCSSLRSKLQVIAATRGGNVVQLVNLFIHYYGCRDVRRVIQFRDQALNQLKKMYEELELLQREIAFQEKEIAKKMVKGFLSHLASLVASIFTGEVSFTHGAASCIVKDFTDDVYTLKQLEMTNRKVVKAWTNVHKMTSCVEEISVADCVKENCKEASDGSQVYIQNLRAHNQMLAETLLSYDVEIPPHAPVIFQNTCDDLDNYCDEEEKLLQLIEAEKHNMAREDQKRYFPFKMEGVFFVNFLHPSPYFSLNS